jgi:hypothetical protein
MKAAETAARVELETLEDRFKNLGWSALMALRARSSPSTPSFEKTDGARGSRKKA